MAQWGNTDDAANSVFWVGSLVNTTANTATQTELFNNTTADDVVENIAVGQFGVSAAEVTVGRELGGERPAHAGWVLRTEGTGGRAGRVQHEVLVAMSTITGDAADDAVLPDVGVEITLQPSNVTVAPGANAVFTVAARAIPSGTVSYAWTLGNGNAIPAPSLIGNATSPTLTINTTSQTSNASYRVTASSPGAVNAVSDVVTLTITP